MSCLVNIELFAEIYLTNYIVSYIWSIFSPITFNNRSQCVVFDKIFEMFHFGNIETAVGSVSACVALLIWILVTAKWEIHGIGIGLRLLMHLQQQKWSH